MKTANEYGQLLLKLGLGDFRLQFSSKEEAKIALAKLRTLQRELRLIKSDINADIKRIRNDYAAQTNGAGAGGALVATLLGSRGLAKNLQASARRSLKLKRDKAIRPYDLAKRSIEDLFCQIENAKTAAQRYLVG